MEQYLSYKTPRHVRLFVKAQLAREGRVEMFKGMFGNALYYPETEQVFIPGLNYEGGKRYAVAPMAWSAQTLADAGVNDLGTGGDADNDLAVYNLDDIKKLNERSGNFFFSPGTTRVFSARYSERAYPCWGQKVTFFVHSTQFRPISDLHRRKYKVSAICWYTGDTYDIENDLGTSKTAHRHAKKHVQQGVHPQLRTTVV